MVYVQRGVLISVEGIDGSGKSSLIAHLHKKLTARQIAIVMTREPGGSDIGREVRKLLQQSPIKPDARAEFLLFAADRAQHFATIVLPALAQHKMVISDRMGDSSVAYQGYGRGLDIDMIRSINAWAMQGRQPNITLYIRVSPEIAYQRIMERKQELTRIEQEKISFFKRVADGYETIYAQRADVCILNGNDTQEAVAHHALTYVDRWLEQNKII